MGGRECGVGVGDGVMGGVRVWCGVGDGRSESVVWEWGMEWGV